MAFIGQDERAGSVLGGEAGDGRGDPQRLARWPLPCLPGGQAAQIVIALARAKIGGDGGKPADERTTTGTPATPESVADAIFAGVAGRRCLVLLGNVSKLSWWVSHLFPRLYERLMVKQLLQPQRESQNR